MIRVLAVVALLGFAGCAADPDASLAPNAETAASLPGGRAVVSGDGTWRVQWRPVPAPIPLNETFAVEVLVQDAMTGAPAGEEIACIVDARMPHHRHGMIRAPRIERTGPGAWRADNLLFHMPGYWELYFDVERDGEVERATDSVELE